MHTFEEMTDFDEWQDCYLLQKWLRIANNCLIYELRMKVKREIRG